MWITSFALNKLEDSVGIKVLSELQDKRLNQFKDQAGFNLHSTNQPSSNPAVRYIDSWVIDARKRELTRKPTWRNFIQVLEEINMGEMAKQIEDFFARTCPDGHRQEIKGIHFVVSMTLSLAVRACKLVQYLKCSL